MIRRDEFLPRPHENFQGWHERVCPEEHQLLKGREDEIVRAARAEGRLSVLFDALTRCPDASDAQALTLMLLAGEHALNERRISVGAVRAFLAEFEKDGAEPDR